MSSYFKVVESFCRTGAVLALFAVGAPATQLMDNLAAGKDQTVVAYGTSLTASGYSAWVGQVQAWLDAQYPGQLGMVNSGIPGGYSVDGLANLDARVLAYHPDTVFIEFAVNDAANLTVAASKANLNTMIDRILAADPGTEIILQTMNSAWDAPNGWGSATARPNLADYYQGYRDVAAARSLLLINHYPAWVNLQLTDLATFEAYVPDGIHPSAAALAVMTTPRIEAALVPEPGTLMLVGGLAVGLLVCRRRAVDRLPGQPLHGNYQDR